MADGTYYARRSARDPAWREAQIAGAMERERQRRELDPEGLRVARREAARRCRAKQAGQGFTFYELWLRIGGDRETLAYVLRDELRRGHIEYRSTSRRYLLNGGIPEDVKQALRQL